MKALAWFGTSNVEVVEAAVPDVSLSKKGRSGGGQVGESSPSSDG